MDPDTWDALSSQQREVFLARPARLPPPGQESNLVNPPSQSSVVMAVCIVSTIITTCCILLRLYVKCFMMKVLRLEDILGILGFGTHIGGLWCLFYAVDLNAIFIHQWNVTMRNFLALAYPLYLIRLFYCFTVFFLKAAILIDWLRIFVPTGTRNRFFWTSWALLVIICLFYIASIFFITLACRPIAAGWKPMIRGTCVDIDIRRDYDFSSASINLVLDVAILFLPQRTIWKLNMSKRKKLWVSLAFSLGLLACASAAGRVATSRQLLRTEDRTYDAAIPLIWALAEMTCGFLVFCVPVMRKALGSSLSLTQLAQSLRSWGRVSRGQSSEGSHDTQGTSRSGRSANREGDPKVGPRAYLRIEEPSLTMPSPLANARTRDKAIPLVTMDRFNDNRNEDAASQAQSDTVPLRGS